MLNPGTAEQLEPMFQGGQRLWRSPQKDTLWVAAEGDDGSLGTEFPGDSLVGGEDGLMT